jgi:uncharacterized protein YdhG (YjbR/CyaY superfamily)
MIREDRYLVLRWDKIHAAFEKQPPWLWNEFCAGLEVIDDYLKSIGHTSKYVVVKDTWPEYEQVWDMIEKRVDENK